MESRSPHSWSPRHRSSSTTSGNSGGGSPIKHAEIPEEAPASNLDPDDPERLLNEWLGQLDNLAVVSKNMTIFATM
jgi:hypothetical protein